MSALADLRIALRGLRRQPGFSALAVLILALGLGAAIGMWALVNVLLLRPLPYHQPERLVHVGPQEGPWAPRHSVADFREYQTGSSAFEAMAAYRQIGASLTEPGESPEPVSVMEVSAHFFTVFRGRALLGRLFLPEEFAPGRDGVVVLSAGTWERRFGRDPAILGRRLRVDGGTVTVVGVMPPEFSDPVRAWARPHLWRPLALPAVSPADENAYTLNSFARLGAGVPLEAARAQLAAIAARRDAGKSFQRGARVIPLGELGAVGGSARKTAWLTMGLAWFVLVIACINLAGVQLARLAARAHEQAVRLALGASRGHLLRQSLAETLILVVAGGALGAVVAVALTRLVVAAGAGGLVGAGARVALDGRVLVVAVALSLVTVVLVGIAPAWLNARGVLAGLGQGGRALAGRGHPRLRKALVVGQMALALTLLAAGCVFVRGLDALTKRDPGWRLEGLLFGRISLPQARYRTREARRAFLDRLALRLAAVPGVENSTFSAWLPLTDEGAGKEGVIAEGQPLPAQSPVTYRNFVYREFFATMGLRLLAGRDFEDRDSDGYGDAGPATVVIINEALARHLWPGQNAVGQRLGEALGEPQWRTVVGVVSDVAFAAGLEAPKTRFQVYTPLRRTGSGAFWLAVRTRGAPAALAASVRGAIAELDGDLPVRNLSTAREALSGALARFALLGQLLVGFAALGLLLAGLGVYGLFAGDVVARTRELGVRMALGAHAGQLLRLVLGQGLRLALLGAGLGVAGATAVTPLLRAAAAELPVNDPGAIVALALVLVAVALVACWVPARRAAAVDPMAALRQE